MKLNEIEESKINLDEVLGRIYDAVSSGGVNPADVKKNLPGLSLSVNQSLSKKFVDIVRQEVWEISNLKRGTWITMVSRLLKAHRAEEAVNETVTAGATSSGGIATVVGALGAGDPKASIYYRNEKLKARKKRRKPVVIRRLNSIVQ